MTTDIDLHRKRVGNSRFLLLCLAYTLLLVLVLEFGLYIWLYQLLRELQSGTPRWSPDLSASAKILHGLGRTNMVALAVLQITTGIVFLVWVYRSDALARALGSTSMAHGPAGSVLWFFAPLVSLFKPYFVLKEIYFGTVTPGKYNLALDEPAGLGMLRIWWLVFVGDKIFQIAAPHIQGTGAKMEMHLAKTSVYAASTFVSILAVALMIVVIWEFGRAQRSSGPFAQPLPPALASA